MCGRRGRGKEVVGRPGGGEAGLSGQVVPEQGEGGGGGGEGDVDLLKGCGEGEGEVRLVDGLVGERKLEQRGGGGGERGGDLPHTQCEPQTRYANTVHKHGVNKKGGGENKGGRSCEQRGVVRSGGSRRRLAALTC